jgi:ABC-2 type transport system ATP-binding protein
MPALLAAEKLTMRYGKRLVLDELSFSVQRGEVFGLLGRNGAGKTTTFQILTGLRLPDSGSLILDGQPIAPGDRRLRTRMGVVFQQPSLDVRLTAWENLLLGAALYGIHGKPAVLRAERLLQLAELSDRAKEPVSRFSGGMKRRLELARALIHSPEILVLDEPTSGLDEAAFQSTWQQLLQLRNEERLTLLLTTHRPEEAERADRLAILKDGKLVACDSPESLRKQVSGDILTLETDDPKTVSKLIVERFQLSPQLIADHPDSPGIPRLVIERERGHEFIPRLVEAMPPGQLRAISLHRPSLADVFCKLTGQTLGARA